MRKRTVLSAVWAFSHLRGAFVTLGRFVFAAPILTERWAGVGSALPAASVARTWKV